MSTPGRKKSQEQVNKKIDKIIHRITHSPKKQQNNDAQIISITPADNTSPSQDTISITPAHHSTPVDPQAKTMTTTQDTMTTSKNNYQLVKPTHQPTPIARTKTITNWYILLGQPMPTLTQHPKTIIPHKHETRKQSNTKHHNIEGKRKKPTNLLT